MIFSSVRRDTPRHSCLSTKGVQLRKFVSRWLACQDGSVSTESRYELDSIFKTSLELQGGSPNLVFFDRVEGQVQEFPYPLTQKSCAVDPKGFKQYLRTRRLGFECYCGLKEDQPQFLEVKKGRFGHYLACTKCGLYMSINTIRATADKFAIYPSMDQNRELQPASVSMRALVYHNHPRGNRRFQQRRIAYNDTTHNCRNNADFISRQSSSIVEEMLQEVVESYNGKHKQNTSPELPNSLEEMLVDLEDSSSKGKSKQNAADSQDSRAFFSSSISLEELQKVFELAFGNGKPKEEDVQNDSPPSYTSAKHVNSSPEPGPSEASGSKVYQIKFCRFCDVGMADEYIQDHEWECWMEHGGTVVSP